MCGFFAKVPTCEHCGSKKVCENTISHFEEVRYWDVKTKQWEFLSCGPADDDDEIRYYCYNCEFNCEIIWRKRKIDDWNGLIVTE